MTQFVILSEKSNGMMRLSLFTVAFVFLSALLGCSDNPQLRRSEYNDFEAGDYQRIICMSPTAAEIVFAVGGGSRTVGVSDYTTYPPEADDLPRCGGYLNPNFEIILSLNPDLIIAHGEASELRRFAERYDIDILPLRISDLESIYDSIRRVGKVLDQEAQAEDLVAEMREELDKLTSDDPARRNFRTLLTVGRDPGSLRELQVVGGNNFLHELLEKVGGDNVLGDHQRDYFTVNKEILARRQPEVIIELYGEGEMSSEERRRYLSAWQGMSSMEAVKNDRVYVIEETFAMLPGPRSVRIAGRLAEILDQAADGE